MDNYKWLNRNVGIAGLVIILLLLGANTYYLLPKEKSTPLETAAQQDQADKQSLVFKQESAELTNQTIETIQTTPKKYLYVINQKDNTVSVINLENKKIEKDILVGMTPTQGIISDGKLYVSNKNEGTVSVIDLQKNEVNITIETTKKPEGIAIYSNTLFVTNEQDDSLTAIDLSTLKQTVIPVGKSPVYVIFDKKKNLLLTANMESNGITLVNPTIKKALDDIEISGFGPSAIAFSNISDYLYVANQFSNDISIIPYKLSKNIHREVTRLRVGARPVDIKITPDNRLAIVANFDDDSLTFISTALQQVTKTINVGASPSSITIEPEGKLAYVTNFNSDKVAVIDLRQKEVIGSIQAGKGPIASFFVVR